MSAMQTRARSTHVVTPRTTDAAAATHGAPWSVQTTRRRRASAVSATIGTLMKPATTSTAASRPPDEPEHGEAARIERIVRPPR